MNPTKKSFLTSIVALVLCLTMFLGTTLAWFTDMVTSSGNIIQSGSLKIDLELLDKESGKWNSIKESKSPLFDYDKWEPGYVDVKVLKVENEGTLALKWKAMFVSDEQLSALADVIDVYVLPFGVGDGADAKYPADRNLDGYTKVGTLKDFVNTIESTTYGNLKAGESAYLGIALKMQDEAGNEYQKLSLGKFNIQIVATQMANESDSFGNDYDANAEWPKLENGYAASTAIDAGNLMLGALTSELTIGGNNGVGAVLPADVKVAEGATSLELTMKKVDNGGNLNLGEGENATSFDVHIAGIASDNEKPMRVDLGAVLEAGLGETELKLYHIENGTPVQMTRVNTVSDFAIHNQYTYDSATGNVSIFVKSFSVFSAVNTSADTWDGTADTEWYNDTDTEFTLTTAEQFAGFRVLVDGGNTFAGKTVKLGVDIDLNNKPFDPIGFGYDHNGGQVFKGTFDGGKHTIYNLYQNCWELDPDKTNYSTYTYSTAGAGLFASIKDATIKNLAISGAEIVFECVDMGIVVGYAQGTCHFENIVVTNSKIANYNRYTGGVVGEVSYGSYGLEYTDENGEDTLFSHTFKNITVDSTVTVSGLWGSFGCGMGGVIGGKWGDATVKMENVVSAPVMDVYNDVVSAYQWYAFRGCGMLIGHTEEPYSDGRHSGNATAGFLKCEDVYVYYGDWVNYHYYEFANQDDATGKRYPWVRAEAGEYCDAFSNIRYGVPTHGGVKVSTLTEEELKAKATNYTPIVFNQLYGADRGMYGTDKHDGVTVAHKNTKTIYFMNANKWTDLKLHYYYVNGDDTWTNVPDGISLGEAVNKQGTSIYKVTVPVYANELYITGATEEGVNTTRNASVAELVDGYVYYMTVDQIKHCEYKEGYKTVYFENNKNWADVYIYYWCNDGKADWGTIEFPGEKMNLVSSEGIYDVYSFVIPAYATGFVFSDGKENVTGTNHYQSVDVKLTSDPDGKIFYLGNIDYSQVVDGNKVNYKYSVKSTTYVKGYKTFTFTNNWNWSDIKVHYWTVSGTSTLDHTVYPGVALSPDGNGLYKMNIPNYASKFMLSGVNPDGSNAPREKTKDILLSEIDESKIYGLKYTSDGKTGNALEIETFRVLYLKPNSNWTQSNAWFAARVWTTSNSDAWFKMTSVGSGIYRCYVPESYKYVIFCRMNSGNKDWLSFDNKWNQTADLTIPTDGNDLYTVKDTYWDNSPNKDQWSKKQ